MSVKKLVYCAMCVALAEVTGLIKIYQFPFGGSVTLCSMLFIVLPGWFYGWKWGTLCGLVYGVLQFLTQPYFLSVPQFILDYILAFSIMGVAGLVSEKKNGLLIGYVIAVAGRWLVATFAGLMWFAAGSTAWEGWSPLPYSMAYNGAYIFAEAAVTVIILIMPPVRKALTRVKAACY